MTVMMIHHPFDHVMTMTDHLQMPLVAMMRAKLAEYNRSASSSAQQGLADDERGNPNTRSDSHNGTIFPWVQL